MGNYAAILYSPTLNKAIDTFFDPTFAGIHQLGWFDWALTDSVLFGADRPVSLTGSTGTR